MMLAKSEIFISIGSNIKPEHNVRVAVNWLRNEIAPLSCSSFYRTAAVGFQGPDFINCVVRGESCIAPLKLRVYLKELEKRAARKKAGKLASRELDLDLLLYGNEVFTIDDFVIPRPGILDEAYILGPLAEIAPTAIHPVVGGGFLYHWHELRKELRPRDIGRLTTLGVLDDGR